MSHAAPPADALWVLLHAAAMRATQCTTRVRSRYSVRVPIPPRRPRPHHPNHPRRRPLRRRAEAPGPVDEGVGDVGRIVRLARTQSSTTPRSYGVLYPSSKPRRLPGRTPGYVTSARFLTATIL